MNKFATIQKIDDNSFQITEYDTRDYQFGIKINYSSIIFSVIICIVVANIWNLYKQYSNEIKDIHNIINETIKNSVVVEQDSAFSEEKTVKKSTVNNEKSPFSEDGFVLPNSSNCYLSEDDLIALDNRAKETGYSYSLLLRYAVNEIYSRHGYRFKEEEWENFYSKYKWYERLHKVAEVPWEKMNEYEQSNLNLLLYEEKQQIYN